MQPKRDSKLLDHPALVPMFGGMEKKPRLLDKEVVTIGRARGCDFCLDGNEVSALHCIIHRTGEGFRVRDCGSRTGTRINGQAVKIALLGNGDVLQIGPFSFEARLPRGLELPLHLDAFRVERYVRSRSHLGKLALRLRNKLKSRSASSASNGSSNGKKAADPLNDKAADLKAKIKQYDLRVKELEESEKELFQDKEELARLQQEFKAKVKSREDEFDLRQRELEEEFQVRWDGLQKELQNLKSSGVTPVPAAPIPIATVAPVHPSAHDIEILKEQKEEVECLRAELGEQQQDLLNQKKELDGLAQKLKTRDKELLGDYQELVKERDELERFKLQWDEEQVQNRKQIEQQRQGLAGAEKAILEQKDQLGVMIDQLKALQEGIRVQTPVDVSAYQKRIDELECDLDAARRQRVDDEQLRQIAAEVETLQAENERLRHEANAKKDDPRVHALQAELIGCRDQIATLEQTVEQATSIHHEVQKLQQEMLTTRQTQQARLDSLEQENRLLREQHLQGGGMSPADAEEVETLRQQNEALRSLAEEMQQKFLSQGVPAQSQELDYLRDQNEMLRELASKAQEKLTELESAQSAPTAMLDADLSKFQEEINLLRKLLQEKDRLLEELRTDSPDGIGDPDAYEADLNMFRKELEADRARLNREIESLRQRNEELDEATREMEMELSRERAEMARERIRLDRMREEVKIDMERLQREQEVRGTLAPVQKLREELLQKSAAANASKQVNDRLRSIKNLS